MLIKIKMLSFLCNGEDPTPNTAEIVGLKYIIRFKTTYSHDIKCWSFCKSKEIQLLDVLDLLGI